MQIEFVAAPDPRAVRAVFVFENGGLSTGAQAIEGDGALARVLGNAPRFTGGKGQVIDLAAFTGAEGRILLLGGGAQSEFSAADAEAAAGHAYNAAKTSGAEILALDLRGLPAEAAARAAFGAELASYRFDRYLTLQ